MRVLPHPIASVSFLAGWLMLNETLSLGNILLGAGVGLVGGWAYAALELPKARPRYLVTEPWVGYTFRTQGDARRPI